MTDSLPPDAPRLRTIREWLADQHQRAAEEHARAGVLATYLRLQLDQVDAALTAADPPPVFYLQHLRGRGPGRSVLHTASCPLKTGTELSAAEARETVKDPVIQAHLEACDMCNPGAVLEA